MVDSRPSCSHPIHIRYLTCSLPTLSLPVHVRYLTIYGHGGQVGHVTWITPCIILVTNATCQNPLKSDQRSWRRRFFSFLFIYVFISPYMGMAAILSGGIDNLCIHWFLLPIDVSYKIWLEACNFGYNSTGIVLSVWRKQRRLSLFSHMQIVCFLMRRLK